MGNFKNSDVLDVIVSGAKTIQGGLVVGATVTGRYSQVDPTPAVNSNSVNATVAGRIYAKYKDAFDEINYY